MSIGSGYDCLSPVYIPMSHFNDSELNNKQFLRLPCGHCLNCKRRKVRNTSIRLVNESRFHKDVSFWTLTYDDEHLPTINSNFFYDLKTESFIEGNFEIPTLDKKDLVNFIKRVRIFLDRKDEPYKIKYFATGEYGELKGRPHYHIMFFGLKPEDFEHVKSLWHPGCRVDYRPFFDETAMYIAGYVQKKLYGKEAENLQHFPEFCIQSQCLGYDWFLVNLKNIIEFKDKYGHYGIPYQGYEIGVPRSYIRRYRREHPDDFYFKPMNIDDFYFSQESEYRQFIYYCSVNDIYPEDVFKQRYKNALHREQEAQNRRKYKLIHRGLIV